jgi:Flp pilus assembly CpaE family ATPase
MNSYLQLFLNSVQSNSKQSDKCSVVAFTSSQSGEGVSFVASSFGSELARKTGKRTLIADLESLQQIDIFHYSRVLKYCYQTKVKNLFVLPPVDQLQVEEEEEESHYLQVRSTKDESEFERGLNNLQTLRFVFDFVLLDCPSLKASGDAAIFAEVANTVILVVEAERTRKEQVLNSVQTIERTKGNLLGCVLNKRQYPMPEWIYRRV